jgi:hypothetical protein
MSQSPDNRLVRVRSAAQEATDFRMSDDDVRRFIALRDQGAGRARIAAELGLLDDEEVVDELIAADESYDVARRIASGELPMYPPPEPDQRVVDERAGSDWVPIVVIVAILAGMIIWALLR